MAAEVLEKFGHEARERLVVVPPANQLQEEGILGGGTVQRG